MRTETTITKIYTFDELSEKAKEKAVDDAREFEAETRLDDLVSCMGVAMDEMGISVKHYYIGLDGSGYIRLDAENDDLEGVRAYSYIVNNFFNTVDKKKFYFDKDWNNRRKSNLERKDWLDNCPFTGWCYDFAVKDAWENWCNDLRKGNSPSVRDFLDELEQAYLKEQHNEYYNFDKEDARDLADANEYEYLEDGTLY